MAAAAQARGRLIGKPDQRDCSAGSTADNCERSAALERKEGTRVPTSQGASEAAVQRTGGRTHPSEDEPDALQKWSRVAEKRQDKQQGDMTRRQCHRIRRGLISAVPAQLSSAKAEHSLRRPNEGEIGDASVNLNTAHPVGYGLTSAVPTLRSSAEPEYSDQRFDEDVGDVAARQRKRQQMKPTGRKGHRIWQGLISAVPAQLSSAKSEHSIRSSEEGEPGDASAKLDATRQVGRGLVSEGLTLRSSAKSECSNQGSDNGGGYIFQVNMIRVHGRQEEERNKPKFGSSRAAPPQGADSGRPSGSSEIRGVGQERRMGPGGAHHKDDHGSSMFTQNQKSSDVPYSVTSSEERYDRTGKSRVARTKSSTLVPEVGYKLCCSDTSGPRYSPVDDNSVRGTDRIYPGVNPVDQDPWNKAMFSVLGPPDHRGPVMDHAEGGTAYQQYHEVLDKGFCRSRERLRNDGTPMRAEQGFGRSRRPLSKVESREDLGGSPNQQQQLYGRENKARDQPSRAYSSLIQGSLLEEAAARGWIEDRRRPAAKGPVENDWRFSGVLGQASGQPRPDTRAWPAGDRLEKVVDVMERSFANLNERITAVELDGDRAGRAQSPRIATVQSGTGEPGWSSASEGSCRPEAPRRRTVGTTPMPEEVDYQGRATVRLGRRPVRTEEHPSGSGDDADLKRRRRTQGHHHAKPRSETEVEEESHVRWRPMRGPARDSSRGQPRTGRTEKSHSRDMKIGQV